MKVLGGLDEKIAFEYLKQARLVGLNATCKKSKCGSIIVSSDNKIIGTGYNSPPNDMESQRRCYNDKSKYDSRVSDKSCCVHAEERAIMDALKTNAEKLPGSRLYFIRLDENGEMKKSSEPYCTICSKLTLDVKVEEFVLYRKEGICVYTTQEYNDLSFKYKSP